MGQLLSLRRARHQKKKLQHMAEIATDSLSKPPHPATLREIMSRDGTGGSDKANLAVKTGKKHVMLF